MSRKNNLPKYSELPLKNYYIVHFDFRIRKYLVYKYESKKTYTVKQMWQHIHNNDLELIYSGIAPHIEIYSDILEKYNLPENRSHRLMTFNSLD